MSKFKKEFIISTVVVLLVIIFGLYMLYNFNIIPHRKYENKDFKIDNYISSVDKDGDGIDDQTDILSNTRRYIATNPKYKSKYYANGYPNDGYGVCTDVVAFSLKDAGYNLMELVNSHIIENPDLYNIEIVDKNIDFRRVRNLKVYFKNTAISLTTDITKIDQWQGGDIIIFEKHIGIVSDRRNKNGVPFVIHHANIYQLHYEEDILDTNDVIVGHYRIS